MNVELANYILSLDKYVIQNGNLLESHLLDIDFPMSFRLALSCPSDLDQNLLINVKESDKKSLKLSLHHQDNGTQNGIIRVDYNGRHLNPVEINDSLPIIFKSFAGQWLDQYNGHIHYVVNGYKPLAWAIPLEFDDFPIKKLNGRDDYIKTLEAFFLKINLKTKINYNHQMRIL